MSHRLPLDQNPAKKRSEAPKTPALLPAATRRLRFRRFRGEDAAWLAPYWGSAAYQGELRERRPESVEEVRSLMDRRAEAGNLDFVFEESRTSSRIGRASFQRFHGESAEIEIEIPALPHRRRGYGSEALGALQELAWRGLRLKRLIARIPLSNAASRALARRQGFRLSRKALPLPGESAVLTYTLEQAAR